MYSYENFVDEVEELIKTGKAMLGNSALTHESSSFRKWKHELEDALKRIEAEDYQVNVKLKSRYFQPLYPCSAVERWQHFDNELDQTLIELQTVFDAYRRYGSPRRKNERPTLQPEVTEPSLASVENQSVAAETPQIQLPSVLLAQPLAPPEKVTWPWLVKHVPVTMWGAAILGTSGIFSAGVAVGKLWKNLS
jgi:hypothetical protein